MAAICDISSSVRLSSHHCHSPVWLEKDLPRASSGSSGTVLVQLEQSADQFVQTNIPLNTIFATQGTVLGTIGLDLGLVSASSGAGLSHVSCQVFEDVGATVTVGNPATASQDAILSANPNLPSHISAIKCTTA